MTHIRLFVDGHVFDGPHQGTTTFLRGIYGSMIRQGSPFEIMIGAQSDDLLEKEPWLGSEVKLIKYRTENRYARLGFEIPSIIRKYQIDYAHFQYFCPPIKNCRWIVTIHDLLFNDFPEEFPLSYRLLRNVLFRHAASLAEIKTTVSDYSRLTIQRDFGIPADQIHVLPNGVDSSLFEPYSREDAKQQIRAAYGVDRYVLYVSRLEPRKNHEALARAFFELELDRKGYQLVFVGRQTLPVPELDRFIADLPSDRRLAFRHFDSVGQSDLVNFYCAADLFVYPSKAEGFGIPPLEAVAMNIPTLCSNATAMADFDFLGDGLFAPDDQDELKKKILNIVNGGVDHAQLADARQAVRNRYSWDIGAQRLTSLILADHKMR
ncbi:glycosyltransferase family 1 protein [Methylomicrobium sp. Wu6]|uniref:glycosyltransferase family 4 protein n=1 Tax=Methylomicrobium sp. Wu6 TaxID=3107928 RepID=UPI002DD61EFB|nr:glycosyltransferase family 1 protein [Methylomicrobium sp. Wu6]MEC4747765.1 glycosyltransferase family 1 protein [Methylomicrobium sp. Wu6]